MSETNEPKRIYIGSFDSGVHHLTIPAAAIRPAEAVFNRERQARELEIAKAKLQATRGARARAKLKQATRLCFKWGKR
jgi:hypothetical protein